MRNPRAQVARGLEKAAAKSRRSQGEEHLRCLTSVATYPPSHHCRRVMGYAKQGLTAIEEAIGRDVMPPGAKQCRNNH